MPQASSLLPGVNNFVPDAKKLGLTPVKPSLKNFRRILGYAGRQKKTIAFVIAFAAVSCSLDIIAPYFMGRAIDFMTGKGQVNFAAILHIVIMDRPSATLPLHTSLTKLPRISTKSATRSR